MLNIFYLNELNTVALLKSLEYKDDQSNKYALASAFKLPFLLF